MSNEQWTNQMKLIANYTEWKQQQQQHKQREKVGFLKLHSISTTERQSSPIKRVLSFNVRLWLWAKHTHTHSLSKGNGVSSSVHDFTWKSKQMIMKLPLTVWFEQWISDQFVLKHTAVKRQPNAPIKRGKNKYKHNKQRIVAKCN